MCWGRGKLLADLIDLLEGCWTILLGLSMIVALADDEGGSDGSEMWLMSALVELLEELFFQQRECE